MRCDVLVTGGAGFIGSHLTDALIAAGHKVRVYDSLEAQVHGEGARAPSYLNPEAEFVVAKLGDRQALTKALSGVKVVFHLAAAVGVGQSMYQIQHYVEYNTLGGAILLDILATERHRVRKLVVASSMSIYGEGAYHCTQCGKVYPPPRPLRQLKARDWEMHCPTCGRVATPLPTAEDKALQPTSIYAITKRDHEEMFICVGRAYRLPVVALRFFNVYGPRQALSNPYTGVAAIFSARLLNDRPPVVYEDGLQSRDFVHVSDAVRAAILAMESKEADYEPINVGTGHATTILDVARLLAEKLHKQDLTPQIRGQFRQGDIRHCIADTTKIRERLGYAPRVSYEDGIDDLVTWVSSQIAEDRFSDVESALSARKLVV